MNPPARRQYAMRGSIEVNSCPAVRIIPVEDPTSFARALFIEALRRHGVRVEAALYHARRNNLPPKKAKGLVRVAEYRSEPLADAIKVTLKVSHNLYASTLPVLVGLKHGDGSVAEGLRHQAMMLKSFGIDPKLVSFASGAGGARSDSTTPRVTVALLQAMAKQPAASDYFDALPILGVDGTLAESVATDSPARGKAHAKTGTLAWYDVQNEQASFSQQGHGRRN